MKKESKLIIGEILLLVEKDCLETFLDEIDVSVKAYLKAKQDFNKIKTDG